MLVPRTSQLTRATLVTLVAAGAACIQVSVPEPAPAPAAPAITTGAGLVGAMHDRWNGRWFNTLTFLQNITIVGANGREIKQQWAEYLSVPGKLRIDYLPLDQKSGVLYADGRVHSFVNGKPANVQGGWNPLGILVADVYAQPVDTTLFQLDSLGFSLGRARTDTWEDRTVWVVGADAGDSTTSQFWVDADSLLVRRVIQKEQRGQRTIVTDARFANYKDVGGYPVAHEVTMYRDGRLSIKQDYIDVVANRELPAEIFDPARFVASQIKR